MNRINDEQSLLTYAPEPDVSSSTSSFPPWKLMIVDDEPDVHAITRSVLEDFRFENRGFSFVDAYSAAEAIRLVQEHQDTAIMLLDVVMENEHAGLDVVRYIREELQNRFLRIILRTGQPGQAPEHEIITQYDINDYKLKSMLTVQSLDTSMISALRSYRDLCLIDQQRQALEQALEEAKIAQKARFQFLANMGHELRTPLHGIISLAEILLRTPITGQQHDYLQRIKHAGWSLTDVLNNILELSEIVEGRLILKESPFSLHTIITEVMKTLKIQAQWKQIGLTYQIAENVPDMVIGDMQRLKQVLMNLLINALKYTLEGQIHLNISCGETQSHNLLFTIHDTGIGIAKDKHQQIFEPFELGEDALTKRFAGAGLGLTISKEIIDKMQGRIWLESEPNQGSTFYFSIVLKPV
ncbi:putative two-component sensor protein histidine kinase [Candidatus Vecturithrix granuli]|uniref:histidine kinase n=1 Tax=Vecturithrix granuli TaxID=1499967 RepID=A0A0S6W5Y1_VECG1|nr:putative two-component sensor protein histidine kinase [Candidatus Vecturithrix granuli]